MNACTYPQSPIALPIRGNFASHTLVLDWKFGPLAKQENTEHVAFYTAGDAMSGTTTFDGVVYKLDSMHFHAPAEHKLNASGVEFGYDGELHIVSKLPENPKSCLVIGIWFQIKDELLQEEVESVAEDIKNIDPMIFVKAVFGSEDSVVAYTYPGSLTTPVDAVCCDGPVRWVIPIGPLAVSRRLFNALFPEQKPARRIQDSTGRPIQFFDWKKSW